MNIAIISYSWGEYTNLSDITFPAWSSYAERHGYKFIHQWDKLEDTWNKPHCLLKHLPDTDLLMWVDCDTLPTNPFLKIDEIWKENGEWKPIVLSADCYGLNCGTMILSNCPIVEMFWKCILDQGYPRFGKDLQGWDEQEAVVRWAHQHPFMRHIQVVPQRILNCYVNKEYGRPSNWGGDWSEGDFIIHFPGLPLERRIELAKEYSEKAEKYVVEREHRTPRPQSEQT